MSLENQQSQNDLPQQDAAVQQPAAKTEAEAINYHSNPFRSFMAQLSLIASINPVSTLLLGLVTALGILVLYFGGFILTLLVSSLGQNTVGFLVFFVMLVAVFVFILRALAASAAVHVSAQRGSSITTKEAFTSAVSPVLGKFVGAVLLVTLFVALGLLLFIVPGLILLARLQLVPFVVLVENKGGLSALKRSWQLTKGHTIEMFGTLVTAPITLGGQGLLGFVGNTSGAANRYHELVLLERSGQPKPETHWLNYLVVILVALFMVGYGAFGILFGSALKNAQERRIENSQMYGPAGSGYNRSSI